MAVGAVDANSIALKSDGTVWVWGFNNGGELGNGTVDSNPHPLPAQVANLSGVDLIGEGDQVDMARGVGGGPTPRR